MDGINIKNNSDLLSILKDQKQGINFDKALEGAIQFPKMLLNKSKEFIMKKIILVQRMH